MLAKSYGNISNTVNERNYDWMRMLIVMQGWLANVSIEMCQCFSDFTLEALAEPSPKQRLQSQLCKSPGPSVSLNNRKSRQLKTGSAVMTKNRIQVLEDNSCFWLKSTKRLKMKRRALAYLDISLITGLQHAHKNLSFVLPI